MLKRMKLLKKFLKTVSTNKMNFLTEINKELFINKFNKSNYFNIRNNDKFSYVNFINTLHSDSLYMVVPIISITGNPDKLYIVLGRSFLVTSYSSTDLIYQYILDKYDESLEENNLETLESYILTFKYKKIVIDLDQLNKKFGTR
jgi:predicted KAP-like P-loop ATPase